MVGDGDLSLSLSIARAYESVVEVTASVLDSKEDLCLAFPDAPLRELENLKVPVLFGTDATQLHKSFPSNHWDLVVFHHPHLGLGTLDQDEAEHALHHHQLICHYLHSAMQVSKLVHVCLCGTQRATWLLDKAAKRQGLQLEKEWPTSVPFSKVWSDDEIQTAEVQPHFAAPRRYRNGKLGSRHFLGKYGYRHRRTAGKRFHGGSMDMNVTGSMHYVFSRTPGHEKKAVSSAPTDAICTICGAAFSTQEDLDNHMTRPAVPREPEERNLIEHSREVLASSMSPKQKDQTKTVKSPESTDEHKTFVVCDNHEGKRLRWFLQNNTNLSKRQAEGSITKGCVSIDGTQVLDSARVLKSGMIVSLFALERDEGKSSGCDVLFRQDSFLIVEKSSALRTKGNFPGTLEHQVSKQEGSAYEGLSALDTSCLGLCVLMEANHPSPPTIQHSMLVLVHGRIPDAWYPRYRESVKVQPKWKHNKKRRLPECSEVESTTHIEIIPLERSPENGLGLSTAFVRTEFPSSASVCQWMRRLGYPVVGDRKCRREYLGLKRSIRNRIKDKVCLRSHRVEVDGTAYPPGETQIPDKLSATYWEDNFGGNDVKEHKDQQTMETKRDG